MRTTTRRVLAMICASGIAACGGDSGDDQADAQMADAEPDAPAIDAPAIDAPAIDAPAIDAPAIDAQATFDVAAEFPTAMNPGGAWAYGWSATLGGALTVFPEYQPGAGGSPRWHDPGASTLGAPAAWLNVSGGTSDGVPNGYVSLHPGPAGEYTVARFTAPHAGTYVGMMVAYPGDSGETSATIYVDGVSTALGVTSAQPSHGISATLAAGDTIEIWIGPDGDFSFDNTPVTLTLQRQ